MATPHPIRTFLAATPTRPAIARGMRAAAATVVPMVVADVLHQPALVYVALGGWMCALADQGGPYPTRAAAMLIFTATGMVSCFVSGLIAVHAIATIALVFVWALACGLARARGDVATTLGNLVLGTFIGTSGVPATSVAAAALRAELFVAGCAWAMLLALVLWPVHPYGPAQRAVLAAYEALVDFAERILELLRASAYDASAWHALVATTPGPVRAAIEEARAAIAATRGRRRGASAAIDRLLMQRELAEDLFTALVALPEDIELVLRAAPSSREEHARRVTALLDRMRARMREPADDGKRDDTRRDTASHATLSPFSLADVLSWDSLVFRHALRLAVTAAAAATIVQALGISRGYWVTLTVIVVLQPYSGATFRRSLQRIGGSVLGGVIAAGLSSLVHTPLVIAALMFPLTVAAVAFLPLNYSFFVLFLTPVFVLMAETAPGDWRLALLRVGNTLLGGALALAAAYVLWPSWEKRRLPQHLADALDAEREYVQLAIGSARGPAWAVDAARRRLGIALNNADASFQRLLDETHPASERISRLTSLLSHTRRLAAVVTSLSGADLAGRDSDDAALLLETALAEVSSAVRAMRMPPPLAPALAERAARRDDRLARLAQEMRAIHESAAQLALGAVASSAEAA